MNLFYHDRALPDERTKMAANKIKSSYIKECVFKFKKDIKMIRINIAWSCVTKKCYQ